MGGGSAAGVQRCRSRVPKGNPGSANLQPQIIEIEGARERILDAGLPLWVVGAAELPDWEGR